MKEHSAETKTAAFLNFRFLLACLALTICSSAISVSAQEMMPDDMAPPPMAIISKAEQDMLNAEPGVKKRTQLSFNLMEARLTRAEQNLSQEKFEQSINELAGFQAILQNTLTYLEKNNDNSRKVDGKFKDFEIYLRKQNTRLEMLRRTMPYKFGYYVLSVMRIVRDTRAKAIEPLFDDSVVREPKKNNNAVNVENQ